MKFKFNDADFDIETGANAGFEVQLRNARGDLTQSFITVLGADSDVYQALMDEKKAQWTKRVSVSGVYMERTPAEEKADAVQMLATITKSWHGPLFGDTPCTKEAAAELYARRKRVYEQLDAAVHTRANFLTASSKSSEPTPPTSSN